jgi:hypothetical protein
MRRTGRAVVAWSLCWYVVAQLAVLCFLKRWSPTLTTNERNKWPQFRRLVADNPRRPLVLMLGSSRTAWAFRSHQLDGMEGADGRPLLIYNFGMPTTGPIHQRAYLRTMLAEGVRPRLLLLEFTPALLAKAHRGITTEESMTEGAWTDLRLLDELTPYFEHPGRKYRAWLEARIAPWYAFRSYVHEDVKHLYDGTVRVLFPSVDRRGGRLQPEQPTTEAERRYTEQLAFDMYGPGLRRFRLGAGPLRAMHEILETCRREGIQAALVMMPESRGFRSLYSAATAATVRRLKEELSARHGVEIIDAERWLADDDFEDGHHVRPSGADRFTAGMRGAIRRLLARRACDSRGGLRE